MKKKILCFDIDGVVCNTKTRDYKKSKPIQKNINKINELYSRGFFIKLFTARFMGRSKENVNIAKREAKKITIPQLKKWKIKYHKLIFGKPTYSIFVDDRNLFHRNDWIKFIDYEIKKNKF